MKPVQEVFMTFAPISIQNSLADCLTKSSANADILITAVKTVRLLEVDVHSNLRTLMEHKDSFLQGAERSCTREKKVFLLNALRISISPASQVVPFHAMCVRTSMDSESQDATKITSALADPRIYSSMQMMTRDMHMNAITIFLIISLSFLPVFWQCRHEDSLVSARQAIRTRNQFMKITIARSFGKSRPAGVCRINRWTKNSAGQVERIENYFYESLAFTRHFVDLEFTEEAMKPEKFIEAPDHAGFNPDTMRVSKWLQRRLSRVTFHTSHLSVAQVTQVLKHI